MSIVRDMICSDIESDITKILGCTIVNERGYRQDPYDAYEKSCGDLEIDFFNKEDFTKVWNEIHNKKSELYWLKKRLIDWNKEHCSMRFNTELIGGRFL